MSFDIVALGIIFLIALAWDLIFSFTTDVIRPACYHLNENHYEAGFRRHAIVHSQLGWTPQISSKCQVLPQSKVALQSRLGRPPLERFVQMVQENYFILHMTLKLQ
jgi:hypothetical protein